MAAARVFDMAPWRDCSENSALPDELERSAGGTSTSARPRDQNWNLTPSRAIRGEMISLIVPKALDARLRFCDSVVSEFSRLNTSADNRNFTAPTFTVFATRRSTSQSAG